MKFSFIMASCGYVENAQTGWLMYGCRFLGRDGFENMGEAIRELALDLYEKFKNEKCVSSIRKECCTKLKAKDEEARFCSKCGRSLASDEFDEEAFMDYIVGLVNTTCDSYGEDEKVADRDLVWYPWSAQEFVKAEKNSVIWILESAEDVIVDALYDALPAIIPKGADDMMSDYKKFKDNKPPQYW